MNKEKINNEFYGKEVSPTDLVMKADTVDIPVGRGVEDLQLKLSDFSEDPSDIEVDVVVETADGTKVEAKDTKKHDKKNKHTMEAIVEHANAALDIAADKSKFIPAFVWRDCKVRRVTR
jgi:hypothetical protein